MKGIWLGAVLIGAAVLLWLRNRSQAGTPPEEHSDQYAGYTAGQYVYEQILNTPCQEPNYCLSSGGTTCHGSFTDYRGHVCVCSGYEPNTGQQYYVWKQGQEFRFKKVARLVK